MVNLYFIPVHMRESLHHIMFIPVLQLKNTKSLRNILTKWCKIERVIFILVIIIQFFSQRKECIKYLTSGLDPFFSDMMLDWFPVTHALTKGFYNYNWFWSWCLQNYPSINLNLYKIINTCSVYIWNNLKS